MFAISDAPVCAAQSVSIVGASLEESIGVHCRVNADPSDVEFEWIFSNSGERIESASSHGQYNIEADGPNGFIGKCAGIDQRTFVCVNDMCFVLSPAGRDQTMDHLIICGASTNADYVDQILRNHEMSTTAIFN